MENGWQMKCGPTLQSSNSRVTVFGEQVRNQMNMNVGQYNLPRDSQEARALSPGRKQASNFSNDILNFGSCKPVHSESGNSFLSISSGPPSLLQAGNFYADPSAQGGVNKVANWPLLQNHGNSNPRSGADVFPSRPTMSSKNCSSLGRCEDLNILRTIITPTCYRNESNDITSLQKGVTSAPSSIPNVEVFCGLNTNTESSLQKDYFVSKKQPSAISGCPRVLCMSACGDLLLSSTGLFGIICSCHHIRMSVSKFCEHSGLFGVNPGYAVRMETGESIAQWRKVYLEEFRIRAPQDHRGWDWPEGLIANSGLANSTAAVAYKKKVFDLSGLFTSSAESVKSTQCSNNVLLGGARASQENANQMSKSVRRDSTYDQFNSSHMGLAASVTMKSHAKPDNPIIYYPTSSSLKVSGATYKERSDDACWPQSFHSNFFPTSENPFGLHFHNLHAVGSSTHKNVKQDNLQGDTVPSRTDLKLGQPSQLVCGLGTTTLSSLKPLCGDVQAADVQEKLTNNLEILEVIEQNNQHSHRHAITDFSTSKETFHLSLMDDAPSAARVVLVEEELPNSSRISAQTPSAGGSVFHKEINKGMDTTHPFSPWKNHSVPYVGRNSLVKFSCNRDGPIRPLDISNLTLRKNQNTTVDARYGHNVSSVGNESSSRLYSKQMESSGFLTRNGETSHPTICTMPARNARSFGMVSNQPGTCAASTYVGNACSIGSYPDRDCSLKRFKSSSLGCGTIATSEASSAGFDLLTAALAPGPVSASPIRNVDALSPHISKELGTLAWRNVEQSDKVNDASLGMTQQLRNPSDRRQQSKPCSISDLGVHGSFLDPELFQGQRNVHQLFSIDDIASSTFLSDADHKKGTYKWEGSGALTRDTNKYNEAPSGSEYKKRQNKPCDSNMLQNGGSYGYSMPNRCSYTVQTNCSNRDLDPKVTGSMPGSKIHKGHELVQAPNLGSTRSVDDSAIEKDILTESYQKGKAQMHSTLNCFSSQWRDVPCKTDKVSGRRCLDAPAHLWNTGEYRGDAKELSVKGILIPNKVAESLKGKQLSDISSGCSSPAVTQASDEVNKSGTSTVDAGNSGCDIDQIVDQGSAIAKSCFSADAIDSVRSSQPLCSGEPRSFKTISPIRAHHDLIDKFEHINSKAIDLRSLNVSRASLPRFYSTTQKEKGFKPRKRKRTVKWRLMGTSVTVSEVSLSPTESRLHAGNAAAHVDHPSEGVHMYNQNSYEMLNVYSDDHGFGRRRSLSSGKMLSRKRDLSVMYNVKGKSDDRRLLKGNDGSVDISLNTSVKRLKHAKLDSCNDQVKSTKNMKCTLNGSRKAKPVACGKYGIICDQELDIDQLKPPKIVPLSQVLKASKRCTKFREVPSSVTTKSNVHYSGGIKCLDGFFASNSRRCNKVQSCNSGDFGASIDETQQMNHQEYEHSDDGLSVWQKDGDNRCKRDLSVSSCRPDTQSKIKGTRMRSLYELSMRGNKFINADLSLTQNVMCAPSTECELERQTSEHAGESDIGECSADARRYFGKPLCSSLISDVDALCCVCGISNKDNTNCLLKCAHCSIRIHQACYGISRVPKGEWLCRPCRTGSKDTVCVLCGYGGGAMTRAFGSRNVVKSLMKAWNVRTESHIMIIGSSEPLFVPAKMEGENNLVKPVVHNSIIAGLFNPSVKQWVHMVCGLWTPGTRCPNVDTMSAFDVSGVLHSKVYSSCYICNRHGGSCIRCRIETCCMHFHPWCAHKKGLLQSEVEGVDRDKVGFYGRCLLHTNHTSCSFEDDSDIDKLSSESIREKEPTCARTEAYKGKKMKGGLRRSSRERNGKGGCLVSQVQLDAWLYINRHKLCMKRQTVLSVSNVENDCRKEYVRYKQAKGWKHLVVYKSGIHALGLYTSQFIALGAMVVEYIGEIVGLRVADKREAEYLSGRKLQYKSACYFFRIDKEQIIDATCKGGIARFVNHSCQPNCFAKVITIRSEKKVVFLAQRDINPGEEITYDYHFNHEDEGKKIPCYCNANNCRRYLN